jgi:LDH2 family malate/lactate/ureidoglycolate dehydrogenase
MSDNIQHFPTDGLRAWIRRVFERLDVPSNDAATVAEALVTASLRGVDTHGVIYAPYYARGVRQGYVKAKPDIRIERDSLSTALVDGDNGLGIVVGVWAMQAAVRRARETGVAAVGAKKSTHFGATAYYAQMAAAEGLVGLSLANTEPVMAPWGGRSPLLGSNPLAIAVPGGIEGGIVLDMATTNVAWGKIYLAARAGQKIPLDWATDQEGQPTDDPDVGLEGLMLPLGGHKGYGLALMIEILCSTLTGAAYGPEIVNGQNIGHCFIAIDVGRFLPLEVFQIRLGQLVDEVRHSKPLTGVSRIYVPGQIEAETMARRRRTGIPIPADLVAELTALGEQAGVPFVEEA